MDPIQNQALRLTLVAFRTSSVQCLCVEANELPLQLRRGKLALLIAIKIAAHQNNPVYETILTPGMWTISVEGQESFQPLVFVSKKSLEESDFNPDNIAKFQFPETPPWTCLTPVVNLILSYAKKNQKDPSIYLSIHNKVKDSFQYYDSFYTDGCFR